MDILQLDADAPAPRGDAVLLVAMDGWTDAGLGGTTAAEHLRERLGAVRVGTLASDGLYDYRDRRPALDIDCGRLGEVRWPELTIDLVSPASGPQLVLVTGPEPDLAWQGLTSSLADLADRWGIRRYVGFGSVPGPIPHTRPVRVVCTSNDAVLLARMGAAHERMTVPASCQVAIESGLAAHGLTTLGMWVRIPHYVGGVYPDAARALLERLSAHLGTHVDLSSLERDMVENRQRLDAAASSSAEVRAHVAELERLYDDLDLEADTGLPDAGEPLSDDEVPTGDELAAEIEQFLRGGA
jgi:hypothetical protein